MLNPTTFGTPVYGQNIFRERGVHVVSVDGPGVGISNLRTLRITARNHDSAMSRVIDFLMERPEVERAAELPSWLHRYNWHRPHGRLRSKLPISRPALE